MKLLLTSTGLRNKEVADFFVSVLPKPTNNCSALLVAYAQNEKELFYVGEAKKELCDLGIKKVTLFNLKELVFNINERFDVIYVCGGNTFAILNRLKLTGLDKFITKEVKGADVVYVGVSAGSIIAGPSIEIAGHGSEADLNEVGLRDTSGLGLTQILVFPHYKDELKREVDEFKNHTNYSVIEATDEEAIYIDDSGHRTIK